MKSSYVVLESLHGRRPAQAADFDGEIVGAGDQLFGRDPTQVPDPARVVVDPLQVAPLVAVPDDDPLFTSHSTT